MQGLKEGFGIIKYLILVVFIILTFTILLLNVNYDRNKFLVYINDTEIFAYLFDIETNLIFKNTQDFYATSNYKINEINKSPKYILSIIEKDKKDNIVNSKITKLKIIKNEETIYDGEYMEDITNIISEKGRYYVHVYSNSQRDYKYIYITTHISFNFEIL